VRTDEASCLEFDYVDEFESSVISDVDTDYVIPESVTSSFSGYVQSEDGYVDPESDFDDATQSPALAHSSSSSGLSQSQLLEPPLRRSTVIPRIVINSD
jgi:hypothetical protein